MVNARQNIDAGRALNNGRVLEGAASCMDR